MALDPNGGPAPYGPPSAVTAVVDAYRNRGLQTPFTLDVLVRAGVTEALAPRVFQSLRLIDLIDEEGNPSAELQALRRAPSEEFRERLAAVIRNAYAPIFSFADPTQDPPERIRDAFRPYEPVGQQSRMVTLFFGLCEYAGIIEQAPRRPAPTSSGPRRQPPRPQSRRQVSARRERDDVLPPGGHALTPAPGLLFGITEEDAGLLSEEEFKEVWDALGRIARARAQARQRPPAPPPDGPQERDEEVSE